jgi:putative membrane protein
MPRASWSGSPQARRWIVAAYAAVVVASGVGARYPADWWLENLAVFAVAAGVAIAWRRFVFLRGAFGLARNPYDRIVHFAFGLLLTYPLRELALRVLHLRGPWAWLLPLVWALSISAAYELVESWTARLVAPELGTAFLGTQGDQWDAQKDMSAALAGSFCALAATAAARRALGREPWLLNRGRS